MSTDTVLTDEQINDEARKLYGSLATDQEQRLARAIEQAVLQSVSQWQPIETAPKDGTVIDLWHNEFGRFPDSYWGLPQHCCGDMGSHCDDEWHGLEPGWVDELNEFSWAADGFTHWMPLPAPPPVAAMEKQP